MLTNNLYPYLAGILYIPLMSEYTTKIEFIY